MPWFTREVGKTKLPRYHRTRGITEREYNIKKFTLILCWTLSRLPRKFELVIQKFSAWKYKKNTKRHFNPVLIVYYFVLNAHIFNKTIQTNFLFVRSHFLRQNKAERNLMITKKASDVLAKARIIPCLETLKIVTLKPTVRNSNSLTWKKT